MSADLCGSAERDQCPLVRTSGTSTQLDVFAARTCGLSAAYVVEPFVVGPSVAVSPSATLRPRAQPAVPRLRRAVDPDPPPDAWVRLHRLPALHGSDPRHPRRERSDRALRGSHWTCVGREPEGPFLHEDVSWTPASGYLTLDAVTRDGSPAPTVPKPNDPGLPNPHASEEPQQAAPSPSRTPSQHEIAAH